MAEEIETSELENYNIHLLMGEFDTKSAKDAIEFILLKNLLPQENRPEYLTLMINSEGGDLSEAFALIDIMLGSKIPVRTYGFGQISSSALMIFMCGQKEHRILAPYTSVMSHQYSWSSDGKEHELLARAKEIKLTSDRIVELYREHTGLTKQVIRKSLLPSQDVWMDANEAVSFGLADKVKRI